MTKRNKRRPTIPGLLKPLPPSSVQARPSRPPSGSVERGAYASFRVIPLSTPARSGLNGRGGERHRNPNKVLRTSRKPHGFLGPSPRETAWTLLGATARDVFDVLAHARARRSTAKKAH
jgi:hypothetical protein